jgi:hypothetical protein
MDGSQGISSIQQLGTGLTFSTTSSSSQPGDVVVVSGASQGWVLAAAYSNSGACWVLLDIRGPGYDSHLPGAPKAIGTYFAGFFPRTGVCTAAGAASIAKSVWDSQTFPARSTLGTPPPSLLTVCFDASALSADILSTVSGNPLSAATVARDVTEVKAYGPPLSGDVAALAAAYKAYTDSPTQGNVSAVSVASLQLSTDCVNLESAPGN